jgi:Bacterial sugar transferase
VTLASYMSWICLVLIAHTYLLYLIPLIGHLRRVKPIRANRIVVAMGDRRAERLEFVNALSKEIPYYHLRRTKCAGITGWVRVRYKYRGSVEGAKEKLRYYLFHIKDMSAGLDLQIFFNTIKIILLGRGSR